MHTIDGRFGGKTVIVTGAGSGIGLATANRLLREGAQVIVNDIDSERLGVFAEQGSAVRVAGDLTDEGIVRALFEAADGSLDGLANVAGIMDGFLPVGEVDDATWERVFAVNVTAVMRCTRAAVRQMSASSGGSIVNVASEAALRGSAAGAAYTAAKHAVVGLSKNAAFMHRADGIRVNVVAPGAVRTGIEATPRSERGFAQIAGLLGAIRPSTAEPEDIAAAIAWLLSDESKNVNGAVLSSDAGWSAV